MVKNRLQEQVFQTLRNGLAAAGLALIGVLVLSGNALALSELQQEELELPDQPEDDAIERRDLPPPGETDAPDAEEPESEGSNEQEEPAPADSEPAQPPHAQRPALSVPLPDPVVIPRDPAPQHSDEMQDADEPVPDVLYDLALLPEPVRRMRELIVEACLSGDIERLRPLISTGEDGTQLSFGDISGDPISFLRGLSGDEHGHEILAILYEVFSAGYVQLEAGTPEEMYVWPYFFAVPLDALTPPQRVELFKIVTAGDYEDMKNYGAYIFYRAGISSEGRWLFFVAGD